MSGVWTVCRNTAVAGQGGTAGVGQDRVVIDRDRARAGQGRAPAAPHFSVAPEKGTLGAKKKKRAGITCLTYMVVAPLASTTRSFCAQCVTFYIPKGSCSLQPQHLRKLILALWVLHEKN